MLNRTTTETKNHKRQIRNNNKNCLSLMTGSRGSSSSLSPFIGTTDAICLLEAHNYLVSQPQKSSIPSSKQTHYPKTTVPDSNLKVRQTRHKSSINLAQKQLTVNSKANKIIDKICFKKRGYPKVETYKMMQHIYYLSAILLTLCALSLSTHNVLADGSLQANVEKLRISPNIVSVNDYTKTIRVELNGNVVKPGDPIPARNFKDLNMAKITWEVSDFDSRHTLLLLDLDRKPGPNITQNIYNQFTSLNIPGNIINAGQTIVAFDTPTVPCQPSTKHRILMLAFLQDQNIDISDAAYMSASSGQSEKRENFKLDDFIKRHRLNLVAANVFSAIGDTSGACTGGSLTLHSIQSVSSSLIAMVIAVTAYGFSSRRLVVN